MLQRRARSQPELRIDLGQVCAVLCQQQHVAACDRHGDGTLRRRGRSGRLLARLLVRLLMRMLMRLLMRLLVRLRVRVRVRVLLRLLCGCY